MSFLFGRRKTPQEMLRQNQRALNKAMRDLDRERQHMEQQEKKIIADIKKMAKQGQMVIDWLVIFCYFFMLCCTQSSGTYLYGCKKHTVIIIRPMLCRRRKLGADFHNLPMPTKITQQTNGATNPKGLTISYNPSPFVINKKLTLTLIICLLFTSPSPRD